MSASFRGHLVLATPDHSDGRCDIRRRRLVAALASLDAATRMIDADDGESRAVVRLQTLAEDLRAALALVDSRAARHLVAD